MRDPMLVVYLFLLAGFLLPGRLIVEPLGSLGAPATLLSLAAAVLYAFGRLVPDTLANGLQPIRTAIVVFGATALLSYGVALTRALSGSEASGSVRSLASHLGFIGLGLLVADAVRDREHLDRLLRLVVWLASVFAVIGIVQYVLGLDPEDYITVPGLVLQEVDINVQRSFLFRVKGTALHPIEFGVVLAVVLPVALHYAMFPGDRPTRWRWLPTLLLLVAIPMTVSRSSALGILIGGALVMVTWPWKLRVRALLAGLVLAVAMRAAFPGLLGTLRSMFLFVDEDPSIEGRTKDYPAVIEYVSQTPWLGRGLGTFTPEQYFFLDNEYLNRLLTGGVVALVVLIALFAVAMGLGRGVYHHATDPSGRALGQALTAATAVSAFAWLTYDGLAFRLNAGLAFILMGAAGALWRLEVGRMHWGRNVDRSRPVTLGEETTGRVTPVQAGAVVAEEHRRSQDLATARGPRPSRTPAVPAGGDTA